MNYKLEPVIAHFPIEALKSTNANILSESMWRSRRYSCKWHRRPHRDPRMGRSANLVHGGSRDHELAIKCSGVPFPDILARIAYLPYHFGINHIFGVIKKH